MHDPRELKPPRNTDSSVPQDAGAAAALLAHYGMGALLAVEQSNATRDENTSSRSAASLLQPAGPTLDREPEETLLIRLSAQKLWAEGQSCPLMNKAESGSTTPGRPPLSDVRDPSRFNSP